MAKKAKRSKKARSTGRKDARLALRVSPEQLAAWERAAAADDRDLPDWVRVTLDRASR